MSIRKLPSAPDQSSRSFELPRLNSLFLALVAALALSVAAAGVYVASGSVTRKIAVSSAGSAESSAKGAPAPVVPSFADLVDKVRPAVVSVVVAANTEGDGFQSTPPDESLPPAGRASSNAQSPNRYVQTQGSGFLISSDGYIVTSYHIVDKAVAARVVMDGGETVAARVVGSDPITDLALLKINHGINLPCVSLADALPRTGEWVLVVGSPFGLGGTATAGIVSAHSRDIGHNSFIQIDAPVNRGNSGSPTFNMSGQVIGVNTAIYSATGNSVGVAFDVPASTVRAVATRLKSARDAANQE
jgi:serine protease Do